VRDYARAKGLSESDAVKTGMEQKSKEFAGAGGKIYVPVGE
jgi:phosphomethylpyrimidine synthase